MSDRLCKHLEQGGDCETCPYSECVYGLPRGSATVERRGMKERSLFMRSQGMTPKEISDELGIPYGTVYGYLNPRKQQ